MTVTTMVSNNRGICPQCGEEEVLFFDDDGELLCSDCIFENESCYDFEDNDGDFGCLFGAKCCMPGLHFRSECYTAEMYEAAMDEEFAVREGGE